MGNNNSGLLRPTTSTSTSEFPRDKTNNSKRRILHTTKQASFSRSPTYHLSTCPPSKSLTTTTKTKTQQQQQCHSSTPSTLAASTSAPMSSRTDTASVVAPGASPSVDSAVSDKCRHTTHTHTHELMVVGFLSFGWALTGEQWYTRCMGGKESRRHTHIHTKRKGGNWGGGGEHTLHH